MLDAGCKTLRLQLLQVIIRAGEDANLAQGRAPAQDIEAGNHFRMFESPVEHVRRLGFVSVGDIERRAADERIVAEAFGVGLFDAQFRGRRLESAEKSLPGFVAGRGAVGAG